MMRTSVSWSVEKALKMPPPAPFTAPLMIVTPDMNRPMLPIM